MGEDMPVELRPKYNFHVFRVDTGEILETIWDIQYTYAMEKIKEYIDNPAWDGISIDCLRFTVPTSPSEELTYTNIKDAI